MIQSQMCIALRSRSPDKPVSPDLNEQGISLCSYFADEQTEIQKGVTCLGCEEAVVELRPSIFKHGIRVFRPLFFSFLYSQRTELYQKVIRTN